MSAIDYKHICFIQTTVFNTLSDNIDINAVTKEFSGPQLLQNAASWHKKINDHTITYSYLSQAGLALQNSDSNCLQRCRLTCVYLVPQETLQLYIHSALKNLLQKHRAH